MDKNSNKLTISFPDPASPWPAVGFPTAGKEVAGSGNENDSLCHLVFVNYQLVEGNIPYILLQSIFPSTPTNIDNH